MRNPNSSSARWARSARTSIASRKKQEWPAGKTGEIVGRIHGGTSLDVAQRCDVVVEAVSEDPALKRQVFEALDRAAPAGAILATNTSSISITEIAATTSVPIA
jgi:3-hydroxybutyryl-CoA dehydrogenase